MVISTAENSHDNLTSIVKQTNAYVYNNISIPRNLTSTLGASFDTYEDKSINSSQLAAKFGFQWNVTDRTSLRAAALRTMKRALSCNKTLEADTGSRIRPVL